MWWPSVTVVFRIRNHFNAVAGPWLVDAPKNLEIRPSSGLLSQPANLAIRPAFQPRCRFLPEGRS
jgi:hypothetical protein